MLDGTRVGSRATIRAIGATLPSVSTQNSWTCGAMPRPASASSLLRANDATVTWRNAEADMVRRRPFFEDRYGTRPYLGQLDMLINMVASYERHEQGHGLFVFKR